jgi:ethanolamine utilization protein
MDKSMQELIASVTQRVLSEIMSRESVDENCQAQRTLVIGSAAQVPNGLAGTTELCTLDDGLCCPENCSKVVITSLTTTQLADIAAGRADSPQAGAVCTALLNGKPIYMLSDAPEHRRYASKCSPGFYKMLEGYVQTVKSFGINIWGETENSPDAGVKCHSKETVCPDKKLPLNNENKLITEKDALAMVAGKKTLTIPSGVIITPSAKDVFAHADVRVIRQGDK